MSSSELLCDVWSLQRNAEFSKRNSPYDNGISEDDSQEENPLLQHTVEQLLARTSEAVYELLGGLGEDIADLDAADMLAACRYFWLRARVHEYRREDDIAMRFYDACSQALEDLAAKEGIDVESYAVKLVNW